MVWATPFSVDVVLFQNSAERESVSWQDLPSTRRSQPSSRSMTAVRFSSSTYCASAHFDWIAPAIQVERDGQLMARPPHDRHISGSFILHEQDVAHSDSIVRVRRIKLQHLLIVSSDLLQKLGPLRMERILCQERSYGHTKD